MIIMRVFRPKKSLAQRYGKNAWVIVTGASDGIGKQFCLKFGEIGFNIILIGRNQQKLDDVAKELATKCSQI